MNGSILGWLGLRVSGHLVLSLHSHHWRTWWNLAIAMIIMTTPQTLTTVLLLLLLLLLLFYPVCFLYREDLIVTV